MAALDCFGDAVMLTEKWRKKTEPQVDFLA